jgi:hypothetical protein
MTSLCWAQNSLVCLSISVQTLPGTGFLGIVMKMTLLFYLLQVSKEEKNFNLRPTSLPPPFLHKTGLIKQICLKSLLFYFTGIQSFGNLEQACVPWVTKTTKSYKIYIVWYEGDKFSWKSQSPFLMLETFSPYSRNPSISGNSNQYAPCNKKFRR